MRNRLAVLYRENPAALTAGILASLAIVWGLWMNVAITDKPFPYTFPHHFHHEIDSPILALELARDPADVAAVTQQNNADAESALRWNTVFDCVFTPLYAGYLTFFGLAYAPRKRRLVLLGAGIALFDYLENAFLFVSLDGGAPREYLPSAIKWTLLGLTLILIAKVLVSADAGPYSTPTRRLLALLFSVAGLLILLGLFAGPYSWLALGAELFAGTFVINAIGLFGPALAIQGKQQLFVTDFCEKRRVSGTVGPAIREVPLSDDVG
jgi:hypothetical protein